MGLKLISGPGSLAIDLAYVKTNLKVEHDEDDVALTSFINAAIDYADGAGGYLGRALVDQTWDLYLDAFPVNQIEMPLPPLIEVLGVFYLDGAGAEQEMDASGYVVDSFSDPGRIVLTANGSWPTLSATTNAVRVRFRAGYVDATTSPAVDDVPEDIRLALFDRVFADYHGGDIAAILRENSTQMLRKRRADLGLA